VKENSEKAKKNEINNSEKISEKVKKNLQLKKFTIRR
jgi:hypothetical protein